MTTRKSVSWFLTDTGRRFSFAAISGIGVAFTVARYAPNTFFIEKYKSFVHYYNNGQPVPLPQQLQDRVEKCMDILNLTDTHRRLISPFSVFGYDMFHAGSVNSKFGSAIGIPINFTYKSLEDLEKDNIQVNQKSVDWTSEVGKKLADALILPERVQEFAICREILMTQNNKIIYDSVYPFASVFLVYNMAQYVNNKLNLYAKPAMIRVTLYSILTTFGVGTYFLMKDMSEVHFEAQTDKKLCGLGPDYVERGKIFYEKLLSRNQALRELMGKEGESKYSTMGNENFGLRHPRLALVHRKQYFEQQLKDLTEVKSDDFTPQE